MHRSRCGAPLATRSNVQQGAFNLDRLELTIATASFSPGTGLSALGANAPNPAGQSLLSRFFTAGISPLGLLLSAIVPTLIAVIAFRFI